MPTMAEVRAMLTGPGGPFEVTTEVVDGVDDEGLQGPPGEPAVGGRDRRHPRRRRAVPRLRRPADRLRGRSSPGRRRVGRRWRSSSASATATGWRCCQPTTRSGACRSGPPSTSAPSSSDSTAGGRPTRSSTACRTRGATGAGRRSREASSASQDDLDRVPDLEAVFLIDADPADFGDDPRLHRFDELTADPAAGPPPTSHRRGRPRGHLLHERHDRAAEGGDLAPIAT